MRAGPMKMAPKSHPLGDRLKLPKQLTMNLRLPKQTVSLREKPLQVKHSQPVVMASVDE
jgi:hypothetical protein